MCGTCLYAVSSFVLYFFVLFSSFIETFLLFQDTLDHSISLNILIHFLGVAGHPQSCWTLTELNTPGSWRNSLPDPAEPLACARDPSPEGFCALTAPSRVEFGLPALGAVLAPALPWFQVSHTAQGI